MKIAIHHRKGSFSERWIEYCLENNINYKTVNAFDNDIIQQVKDCDAFMWHHHHAQFKDVITAKRILFALEQSGVTVFPDFNTGWHFDDKVAQKYLFQTLDIPHVPSYIFYDKKIALSWAKNTTYPKVFKLKGGAGSTNVKLVKNVKHANELIHQAFGKGFKQYDSLANLYDSLRKIKYRKQTIKGGVKSLARLFIPPEFSSSMAPEKGYIYFQEFIPNNDSDIRVIVIKDKAFAIKRMVRPNDFRASGSGTIAYDPKEIDLRAIEAAFIASDKIKSQCIAFDFIFDKHNNPMVIEISYGFSMKSYDNCPGYWDKGLNWHQGKFNPQEWMIDDLIKSL